MNKTWNEVIKEGVWGNKRVRKKLEEKLVQRWKTTNPETVQLCSMPPEIQDIFCNNTHVFCGIEGGEVKVYTLTDGQWVRDLESGDKSLKFRGICGGESIVAANLGRLVVTVWSSKKEMVRLHSFDLDDHDGMEDRVVENIKATGTEIILLVRGRSVLEVPDLLRTLKKLGIMKFT